MLMSIYLHRDTPPRSLIGNTLRLHPRILCMPVRASTRTSAQQPRRPTSTPTQTLVMRPAHRPRAPLCSPYPVQCTAPRRTASRRKF